VQSAFVVVWILHLISIRFFPITFTQAYNIGSGETFSVEQTGRQRRRKWNMHLGRRTKWKKAEPYQKITWCVYRNREKYFVPKRI